MKTFASQILANLVIIVLPREDGVTPAMKTADHKLLATPTFLISIDAMVIPVPKILCVGMTKVRVIIHNVQILVEQPNALAVMCADRM